MSFPGSDPQASLSTSPSTTSGDGTSLAIPDPGGASGGHLSYLVLGLVLFVVLWVVPLVLFVWAAGGILGSIGIAEALEHTRGLAPTTFGGAFWLAAVFTGLMVILELRALLSQKRKELGWFGRLLTRPSTGLFFLIGPTIVLVRLDLKGTDVPDVLTTALLLCCLGYVYFILPLALLGTSWRITRWMWRVGKRSGFASGVLGTLGLAFASCVPVLCAAADEDAPPEPAYDRIAESFERAADEADRRDTIDGALAFLGVLAEVIPNDPTRSPGGVPWLGEGRKDLFEECIETLHRDADGVSRREETIRYFVGRGTARDVAEQVVQDTLLEVCLGHAKRPYDDLTGRFRWLSQQRRKNGWRRDHFRDTCAVAIEDEFYGFDPMRSPEVHAELLKLDRALCAFTDPRDGDILRLWAAGFEAAEIGTRLRPPLSAAAVRQRKKRALAELRTALR